MAAIGWYGPLIDLSKASSYIGAYVQLLVFVHKSTPVQYKLLKGREVSRRDIQVGDDTRPFFSLSIWQKQLGSMVMAGSVILLQNVRVLKIGDIVEARTVQHSSLKCLFHPHKLLVSKGRVDLIEDYPVGITTKEKLGKVIAWVQRAGLTLLDVDSYNRQEQLLINSKVHEERQSQGCFSLVEVLRVTKTCKATFYASVGEIFLPMTLKHLQESDEEKMFISRRLLIMGDNKLVDDLICTGCQICGSPLNSELGSIIEQNNIPLYCQKSSNGLHIVSLIYRPFMLYVWDDSKYIPLLVTNKAAELLFGNIRAERVRSCYNAQHRNSNDQSHVNMEILSCERAASHQNVALVGGMVSDTPGVDDSMQLKGKNRGCWNPNFYLIWLIMLKLLLQQGKDSPLKFKIRVNASKNWESGRYEMVSVSMPCLGTSALVV